MPWSILELSSFPVDVRGPVDAGDHLGPVGTRAIGM